MAELRFNPKSGKFHAMEPGTDQVMAVGRLEVDLIAGSSPPTIYNGVKFITEDPEVKEAATLPGPPDPPFNPEDRPVG